MVLHRGSPQGKKTFAGAGEGGGEGGDLRSGQFTLAA